MKRLLLLLLLGLTSMVLYVACGGGGNSGQGSGDDDGGVTDDGGGGGDAAQAFHLGGTVTGLSGTWAHAAQRLGNPADQRERRIHLCDRHRTRRHVRRHGRDSAVDATQTCTVANGSGTATANVTNVTVTCASTKFTVGGTVIGLSGTGLVLQDNNTDDLTVSANGTFSFATPVASGSAFAVTVKTQPSTPTQTCTVTGGTGTVGSANITDVMVNCATDTAVIGGQVTGLLGGSVVLQDNGGDNLTVSADGTFAFAAPLASGATYAVTVLTQPTNPSETCVVTMGTGTVATANVTNVSVTCTINSFTIGGTVTRPRGTGLVLQDNGGDNLTVSASGTFTFATSVVSGGAYAVTILTQPTNPTQTCVLTNDTGTVGSANVTNVSVVCTTNTYTVGGTLTGLAATDSVVLQDNGADDLTVSANGAFTFATSVASGANFAVTVLTQPGAPAQTCVVSGGTGTIVAGNVSSVTVNCTVNTYTVGGTVSGLAGTLVLQDNGGDNLSLTMNGTFAFATPIASELPYAVTVLTQPGTPAQTCVITNGSGTVTNANVTSVAITCTTNTYTVGGTVSGLAANETVILQDNGADDLTIHANGRSPSRLRSRAGRRTSRRRSPPRIAPRADLRGDDGQRHRHELRTSRT